MFESILTSEFVEQMDTIAEAFRQSLVRLEDLFRGLTKMVKETKKALKARPRTSHRRRRPARISEGYPWLWVVPHS